MERFIALEEAKGFWLTLVQYVHVLKNIASQIKA